MLDKIYGQNAQYQQKKTTPQANENHCLRPFVEKEPFRSRLHEVSFRPKLDFGHFGLWSEASFRLHDRTGMSFISGRFSFRSF